MNERPNREASEDLPHGRQPSDAGDAPDRRSIPLREAKSLERLRSRVEEAARELKRLREENDRLARRIEELEGHPAGRPLGFQEDPEALARKIKGFIQTIDQYLQTEEEDR